MNLSEIIRKIVMEEIKKNVKLQKLVKKSLKKAPEGYLVMSRSNGVNQFFHKTSSEQKKGHYIKKKDIRLISALAQKEYDLAFLRELNRQAKSLNWLLRFLPGMGLDQVYDNLADGKKPYVKPHVLSDQEYVKQWLAQPYQGMHYKEECKKYQTERGEMVRSKSEKILADKLYKLGIPYRYEYPVPIDRYETAYPDFVILKVSTREEIFVELMGMMEDLNYLERQLNKLKNYARVGIVLGKNLFIIMETKDVPMDMGMLDKMIKEFY